MKRARFVWLLLALIAVIVLRVADPLAPEPGAKSVPSRPTDVLVAAPGKADLSAQQAIAAVPLRRPIARRALIDEAWVDAFAARKPVVEPPVAPVMVPRPLPAVVPPPALVRLEAVPPARPRARPPMPPRAAPPPVRVIGHLEGEGRASAFVVDSSGVRLVETGDSLGAGWQVGEISPEVVVLLNPKSGALLRHPVGPTATSPHLPGAQR